MPEQGDIQRRRQRCVVRNRRREFNGSGGWWNPESNIGVGRNANQSVGGKGKQAS